VSNAQDIITRLGTRPFDLALGGHLHTRETLRFEGSPIRFFQSAAVVGPTRGGPFNFTSGIVVYRVKNGEVDDGTFVPLP
jgi:hypothetical protein